MDEQFPLALQPGTVLAGQYIIQKVLGQGGFGITYMAEDHKTGQKVAVKEFFPDTLASRTQNTVSSYPGERTDSFQYGKMCFLQEAETLATFIGSENIVKIHSYFEENGTAYFVMDFVEGISFDEYIAQHGGKIPYEDAERVLLPIIDALALVHSKGIVHRDVTPDNIYITKDGTVKLLDFGAARYSLGDKSRSLDVVLKHGFAPKEQYTRHGRQGPFTDVYTVGASFYFAVTGKRPPDSIDRMEEDDLVPPSSLGVEIPPQKEDAILKAMSVQPGDRFQTMDEFKRALLAGTPVQAQSVQAPVGAANQRVFTAPQPVPQTPVFQPTQPFQGLPPVQQTGQPPAQAGAGKKRKKPILIAVAAVAAAAVLVGIVVLVSGILTDRKDKPAYANRDTESSEQEAPRKTSRPTQEPEDTPQPTQAPTEKPTDTPQPTQAPTEPPQTAYADTVEILGNSVADIKNQNMICTDPETGDLYYFRGDGFFAGASGNYLLPGVMPYSLSVVGDYIYYVDSADGKAYRVNKNGGKPTCCLEASCSILAFYVSDSYLFVYLSNGQMLRWNIQENRVDGRADTGGGLGLATFSDGYLYYVAKTGEGDIICKVSAGGDWTNPQVLFMMKEEIDVEEICVEGDRIYVLLNHPYWDSNDDGFVDANGKVRGIVRCDAVSGDFIAGDPISSSSNAYVQEDYYNMRVKDGIAYCIVDSLNVTTGIKTIRFDQYQFELDGTLVQTLYTDTNMDACWSLCFLDGVVMSAYGRTGDIVRLYLIPLDGSDPEVFDYTLKLN